MDARVKPAYQARFALHGADLIGTVAEKPLVLLPATGHPVTLAWLRSQQAALKLNLGIYWVLVKRLDLSQV